MQEIIRSTEISYLVTVCVGSRMGHYRYEKAEICVDWKENTSTWLCTSLCAAYWKHIIPFGADMYDVLLYASTAVFQDEIKKMVELVKFQCMEFILAYVHLVLNKLTATEIWLQD